MSNAFFYRNQSAIGSNDEEERKKNDHVGEINIQ
jgi:hypothetical protein